MTPNYTIQLNKKFKDNYKKLNPFLENKRNVTYFTLFLSILTLSFFGVFAIRPTLITAVSLNREITDLKFLNEQYEKKITDIVIAQSEYEKIRDDIPLMFASLPESPEFTKLIINEESIASNSGMEMLSLQLDPLPISKTNLEKGKLVPFNLSLTLSGDSINMSSFLDHFLRSQRIVSIANIDFNQVEGTSGGKIKVSLAGKSYYAK